MITMLLCLYIIFVEALIGDVVQGECVPKNTLRVIDASVNLYTNYYVYCYIDNVCQNSHSFIYYNCDIDGDNCKKMFAYFSATASVSYYGNTNRSVTPYYSKYTYLRIRLENVQSTDDGIWKIYISSTGSDYECVNYNVTTYVRPKGEIRIIPFKASTHKKLNLTCLVNEIRPVYRLYLEINDFQFRNGIQIDTPNGDTWNISYTVELVHSPNYPLTTRCFIAYRSYFSRKDLWAYSDNFVFNPFADNQLTFHPLEEAVIGCAMPINYTFIGWMKNDEPVSESDIYTVTRTSEVRGFFDFTDPGVVTAQYSELRFSLPRLDQGCDVINEYAGLYQCEAIDTTLGKTFQPASRHVLIEYAPTLESVRTSTYDLSTLSGAYLMIVCPLCSYPQVEEYKWWKGNIQLGNARTLMIPYVTEGSFGTYTCFATNRMGSTNFTINVIKIVDIKSKLYHGNLNKEVIMACPLCDDSTNECNWHINDEHIHTGRLYTIESLAEGDYGEYLCTAVFVSGRSWMRIELTKPQTNNVGGTESYINASERQKDPGLTADVIAGFAVMSTVVVGMIVAITVLGFMLIKKQRSRDDATGDLSNNATTNEETPHIYEKINVAFGNNPVYENTQPYQASGNI